MATADGSGRRWNAAWVWSDGDQAPRDSYTCWRTVVHLDEVPEDLVLYLSADLRYRLWVNDMLIGDGPPPSAPQSVYYDSHQLRDLVLPGENCLAVVVRCTGQEPGRRAGLLAELESPDGTVSSTGADTWRCRPGNAWSSGTAWSPMNRYDPWQERFDARREPLRWRTADFDDSTWEVARPVASVGVAQDHGQWGRLLPRPIPAMEETVLRPVSVAADECLWLETRTRDDLSIALSQAGRPLSTARADQLENLITGAGPAVVATSDGHLSGVMTDGVHDPCLLLDLGRQVTAYPEIDVTGPAGAVIDIGMAERLVDGHFTNALEGQFACRYVLREGRQLWRATAWRGFRYLRIRVGQSRGPVVLHAARAIETRYPFDERGSFESAQGRWSEIVDLCRRTVRLCCQESILDTPWREQSQWLGDVAAVTAPAIRTLFGDTDLVEKFFRQAAETIDPGGTLATISNAAINPDSRPDRDIPDYTLWWVIDLLEHYRYTGTTALLRELYPVVRQVMEGMAARLTAHGTLPSFGWVFIDWAPIDKEGECAALNAIFYGALRSAAEIAAILGEGDDHDRWVAVGDRLRDAFATRFWSTESAVYVDARHADDALSERVSEQTNFAAIRFGLVDGPEAVSLAERVLSGGRVTEAQPYFCSVVLDGLHRIGRRDLALNIIDQRWGDRMVDRGATSCFEEWGINGSWRSGDYAGFMRTLSHAWSAHPATFMIKNVAGIEILTPGCRRLRIDPYLQLDYRVRFPTPLGTVQVEVLGGRARIAAPAGIEVVSD